MTVSGTQARTDPAATSDTRPRRELPALRTSLPTLYKAMIITSFVINMILVLILLLLGGLLFQQREQIMALTLTTQGFARENLTELTDVVAGLETATIRTTIAIDEPLPVTLNVPIDQETIVTTVAPVPISVPAAIDLGPFGQLFPNVNLSLPPGTQLNIKLKLDVPLVTTIPVKLNVPVEIPLKDTQLGPLFTRLGDLLDRLLAPAAPLLGMPATDP